MEKTHMVLLYVCHFFSLILLITAPIMIHLHIPGYRLLNTNSVPKNAGEEKEKLEDKKPFPRTLLKSL